MAKNPGIVLLAGIVISIAIGACQSPEEKQEITEPNQNLKDTRNDPQAEYQQTVANFAREANNGIAENERRILDLRKQASDIDARYNAGYYGQLDKLERRNKELAERVKNFEDSDEEERWSQFRDDVKRDLADLTSDLEEFALANKE